MKLTTGVQKQGWLNRNVVSVGFTSLLTDISSKMVVPLIPSFLADLSGIPSAAAALGLIEGVSEVVASVLKLASGRLADKLGRLYPLMLGGYAVSAMTRPLMAIATSVWHVLAIRSLDRVGKGVRTSPRDSLIARSTLPERHGAAFGFHRMMDHIGAVIGPLIATLLLATISGGVRTVFLVSVVPALIALGVLMIGIREPQQISRPHLQLLVKSEDCQWWNRSWRLLIPVALFTLGNASDLFILLKIHAQTGSEILVPTSWIVLHVFKSIAAVPGGRVADSIGPRNAVLLGWSLYVLSFVAFAFVQSTWLLFGILFFYGGYYGLTEASLRSLVSSIVTKNKTATAFGRFHLTLGLSAFVGNTLFGLLWLNWGGQYAFLFGACTAILAIVLLARILENKTID